MFYILIRNALFVCRCVECVLCICIYLFDYEIRVFVFAEEVRGDGILGIFSLGEFWIIRIAFTCFFSLSLSLSLAWFVWGEVG